MRFILVFTVLRLLITLICLDWPKAHSLSAGEYYFKITCKFTKYMYTLFILHSIAYFTTGAMTRISVLQMANLLEPLATLSDFTKIQDWCGQFKLWASTRKR